MQLSLLNLSLTRVWPGFGQGSSLALDFTSGNNTLDPRITFSRTSNATLTGSNGLIQYAPHNLLTYSEQFDNAAWTKTSATVTANAIAAPNGTLTADKLVEDTATSVHQVQQNQTVVSGTIYTITVYAKQAERSIVNVYEDSGTNSGAWFYLNSGTVGTVAAGSTATITSVGNGWYRCSCTFTAVGALGRVRIAVATTNGANSYTGDGTSGIYIWGAQLNVGALQDYNPTTVKNLLGYTQEFDNAAWTKSNSFVQTNLLTYSQDFDNAAWAKTRATVSANTLVAPDGTLTADKLAVDTTPTNTHRLNYTTALSATAYTVSCFAKKGELNYLILQFNTVTSSLTWFDLDAGTVSTLGSGVTASITAVGNGWYRCSLTGTPTAGTGDVVVYPAQTNAVTTTTIADGTSGIFIWGAQLVQGTTPGDYKATYAAPAAVGYPDIYGQPFAQKLVEDTSTSEHSLFAATTPALVSGATYTVSSYFNFDTGNRRVEFRCGNNAAINKGVLFSSTGQFVAFAGGSNGTIVSYGSVDVGNGWFRIWITFIAAANVTTGPGPTFYLNNGTSNVYTGDGTSGIYIWGAQISDSASVDPYVYNPVAAPSAAAYYGPRFDYDPITLAPKGLLIEEQRTNLVLNSSILNTQIVTVTAAAHTLSFYGTGTIVLSGAYTGTLVGTGNYPTRTTLTFTPIVGALTLTVTGSVTMAQLEAGAFATSYIPTVASQVTRAADIAQMLGANFSNWYNVNEGSFWAEADSLNLGAHKEGVLTAYQDGSNFIGFGRQYAGGGANVLAAWVYTGAVTQAYLTAGSLTAGVPYKASLAYKTNDIGFDVNGGTVATDTSATLPTGISQLILGRTLYTTEQLNGHLRRIAYYNRRLANSELQGITT